MKLNKIHLLLLVIGITSCNTLIDLEDIPQPAQASGTVKLLTDWDKRTTGIDVPSSYTVALNKRNLIFQNLENTLPELQTGVYPALIYNEADKISVSGSTATVFTQGDMVESVPGWLFSSSLNIIYEARVERLQTATMMQQVRQLNIVFNITTNNLSELAFIESDLTGVANSLDLKSNLYNGSDLKVKLLPNREDSVLTLSGRLIGLTTEVHKLRLKLILSNGKEQRIEIDLSNKLENFNSDKHVIMTLTANMEINIKADIEATIEDWEIVDNGNIIVN